MIWRRSAPLMMVGLLRATTALADETPTQSVIAPPAAPFGAPRRSEILGEAGVSITHRRLQVQQLAQTPLAMTPPSAQAPLQGWVVALATAIIRRCWTPTSAGRAALTLPSTKK